MEVCVSILIIDKKMKGSETAHREFWLRNGRGIIGLWKKYILLFECRQNQGKKNF